MGTSLLSWTNHVDATGTVIEAGSALSTLPAVNVADPVVQRAWRTSGSVTDHLLMDFGSTKDLQVLALAGVSLGVGDTVRHRLDATTAGAGALLDTGSVVQTVAVENGMVLHVLSAAVQARYWRVDIDAPSRTATGYLDVGRAWAGPAFLPQRQPTYGMAQTYVDESIIEIAPVSGVEHVRPGARRRVLAFSLDALSANEVSTGIGPMLRSVGVSGQVLMIPDTQSSTAAQDTILGRLTATPPIIHAGFDLHTASFELRESL